LFYNQFEYCIGFQLDEVHCLRDLDHDKIDQSIERRKVWREMAQQRWSNNKAHSQIVSRRWKNITDATVLNLHNLAEILLSTAVPFKLVVSLNQGHVYTNSLELIDQLDNVPALLYKQYTQATVNRPKNTIRLQNPKHQYRSYFKLTKITAQEKINLVNFFTNQQECIRVSPALKAWVDLPFNRTQDYFFIDYDSPSWLTMIGLIHPGLIRKTMSIIPHK
jgi:hypothetical protein